MSCLISARLPKIMITSTDNSTEVFHLGPITATMLLLEETHLSKAFFDRGTYGPSAQNSVSSDALMDLNWRGASFLSTENISDPVSQSTHELHLAWIVVGQLYHTSRPALLGPEMRQTLLEPKPGLNNSNGRVTPRGKILDTHHRCDLSILFNTANIYVVMLINRSADQ